MTTKRFYFALLFIFVSFSTFAANIGTVTHPIALNQKQVTTEFDGVTSTGGGIGVQIRYTQKVLEQVKLEAGVGMSGGEYSGRAFLGADFQILEDYDYQPRVSMKTYYENAKEFGGRLNKLGVAPTASKGFNISGREIFPFVALPFAVNLNGDSNTYKTSLNLNLGATGKLSINSMENLVGNLEAMINLKDSYTGAFAGVTYTFN